MIHYQDHITSNRQVMLGKPVIKGTRITVELILQLLSEGATIEDLLTMYPHLERDNILGALNYAALVIANEEMIEMTA